MIALRLVAADLRARMGLITGTILLVAIPLTGFLLLDGFNRGIDLRFHAAAATDLLVQESNSVGEITGSRISARTGDLLLQAGESFAIPEVHAIAGTSNANAVLLRGVDLDRYRAVITFDVVSGRPLEPGDDERATFIGSELADARGVGTGDTIRLRGRDFTVVGVFTAGTYVDNEAWVSLPAAQDLLGWGTDVSLFVIPGGGPLAVGDRFGDTLSVVGRGEVVDAIDEWDPILGLGRTGSWALAVAASIILSTVLWRLAWLRRRDLAVLRALGMGPSVVVGFLAGHGAFATVTGLGLGTLLAWALVPVFSFQGLGFATRPVLDPIVIIRAAALGAGILVAATSMSGVATLRRNPASALHDE
ncbi:MAG TPA: ABC transporter permease [Acidimicrobiia bacterium]|nr:ABC transporter permease [Acidimicrobiia bacterium]